MKKVPFIILLIAELLVGLIAIGLLLSNLGVFSYLMAAAIFAAVLTPFFIKLKKTEDGQKKARLRRRIFLIMLTPVAVAAGAIIVTVISLFLYFG